MTMDLLLSAEDAPTDGPTGNETVDQAVEGAVDLLNVLLWMAIGLVAAVLVAFLFAVAFRLLERRRPALRPFSRRGRAPLRATLVVVGLYFGLQVATRDVEAAWEPLVDHALLIAFIGCLTWLTAALVYAVEDLALSRNSGDSNRARRVRTQMQILRRVVVAIIITLGVAGTLLTFPGARAAGASLLASAGIISVVAGLAAQTSLANVFAGMQLAFSDAIRVDDIVVVEGEWGRIEEITLTYVVVHIWDDRRLIMPSTYFTTTPFENWTRQAGQLLGTVEFDLDWTVPVAAMRRELNRILASTDLWDGRVGIFQVLDAVGGMVRVRALVSGPDSPTLTDLKYHVRESLLLWLQREAPYALPRSRFQQEEQLEELPEHPEPEGQEELEAIEQAPAVPGTEVIDVPAPAQLDPETAARQAREIRRARRLARRRGKEEAEEERRPAAAITRAEPSNETTRLMTRAELGLDEPAETPASEPAETQASEPAEKPATPAERGRPVPEPTAAETTGEDSRFFTANPEGAARAEQFRGPGPEAYEERERTALRHRSGFLGDAEAGERDEQEWDGERPSSASTDETTVLRPVRGRDATPGQEGGVASRTDEVPGGEEVGGEEVDGQDVDGARSGEASGGEPGPASDGERTDPRRGNSTRTDLPPVR